MMKKQMDVNEILSNLSLLRVFDGQEEAFWQKYLENISELTKSSVAILISKDEENWQLEKEYLEKGLNEEFRNELLKASIPSATRALDNIYAYEKYKDNNFIVCVCQESLEENKKYVLVLLVENNNKVEFSNVVLRSALCRDIILNYETTNLNENENLPVEYEEENKKDHNENFEKILALLNTIIYESKFNVACMKIVDELANEFNCNKVSLGWEKNSYIKTIAINQVEHFQKSSASIKALEAILEESYEQDDEIFYPDDEDSTLITHSHKIYHNENNLSSIYTFPIRVNEKVVGVVSFEKNDGVLQSNELEIIRLALNYIAPSLKNIYDNDLNVFKKVYRKSLNILKSFLGPKNTIKKFLAVCFSILLLWVFFGKLPYKVEAVTNLQTDNILYLSAPFDGIAKDVNIDIGDFVKENDTLIKFDTQELLLKKFEINADIIRYATEEEKARASRSLADMKISAAKKEQSESSLKKIDYYLEQASIKAPFDGIIVEGDKEKLLGSPFSKGDIILQVANPTDLYAKVKVLEEYIDEIKIGQVAQLNLLSRPDTYFKVRVEKIIPMAKVDDVNGNVFTLKVVFLDDIEDWMRPGMSGIVKIEIEDRSILWILTHKISDYFHMHIWW